MAERVRECGWAEVTTKTRKLVSPFRDLVAHHPKKRERTHRQAPKEVEGTDTPRTRSDSNIYLPSEREELPNQDSRMAR